MMFKKDFVAVIKCDGKILREDVENVLIPFGSEYSILLKNLRSRKAEVGVTIDGQDVLDGHKLIIDGNKEVELERFIQDLSKGNKFKFIQKTEKIQEHRGDKIDDGILRIEFKFEKDKLDSYIGLSKHEIHTFMPTYTPLGGDRLNSSWDNLNSSTAESKNYATMDSLNFGESTFSTSNCMPKGILRGMNLNSTPQAEEGITTKGSISNQQFKYGSIGELESNSYVINLQLKGFTPSGNIVSQPVTIKTPKVCSMCGTNNKNTSHYCKECGTYLD